MEIKLPESFESYMSLPKKAKEALRDRDCALRDIHDAKDRLEQAEAAYMDAVESRSGEWGGGGGSEK